MDIAEYKRIIVRLRPSLLTVARNITANNEDAEDLVQDVCLKIWHQRDRFEQFNNLEAYSIAMVKHLSIDKIRNRRSKFCWVIAISMAGRRVFLIGFMTWRFESLFH